MARTISVLVCAHNEAQCRRLFAIGRVGLFYDCYLDTSARRYVAMGKGAVIRLYVRNFTSEILHHRPKDTTHLDVREV